MKECSAVTQCEGVRGKWNNVVVSEGEGAHHQKGGCCCASRLSGTVGGTGCIIDPHRFPDHGSSNRPARADCWLGGSSQSGSTTTLLYLPSPGQPGVSEYVCVRSVGLWRL